jgi:DedD protein
MKQKSVYLLHLDTPRIILISAVITGIIVASFLIGMNFVKNSGEITPAASDNIFMNDTKSSAVFDERIPAPPHRGEGESGITAGAQAALSDETHLADESPAMIAATGQGDVITSESIKEIIPPSIPRTEKKAVTRSTTPAKKARHEATGARKKESTREVIAPAKKKQEPRVVAAADSDIRKRDTSPAFAVQIASYDKKSRALSEAALLKDMSYDAYIDESEVRGRNFYRVRIGPLSTRERAAGVLRDVQSNERYAESYIVRE